MIDVKQITALHENTVRLWHAQEITNPYRDSLYVICEQHKYNFILWHEEDIARSVDVSDERIAAVKRAIDKYNQRRNDWIEKIDDHLKGLLNERRVVVAADARFNTETPGSAIDRLSILALRVYHMREQADRADATAEHAQRTQAKLSIATTQLEDLSVSLGELLADLTAGRKRLKIYRQLKMYNDPTLNPYLYDRQRVAS